MRSCAFVLVVGSLFVAAPASADVVMPPPPACPRGAMPTTGHMGPYCVVTECSSPADCDARWYGGPFAGACAPAGLCVRDQESFGGRGGRVTMRVALGSCATDADCPGGVPCLRADRCVADGATTGPVDPRFLPRIAPAVGASAAQSCGAMGIVALLALVGAGVAFGARREARQAQAREILAALEARGHVRARELGARVDDAIVARALAPLAHRVRVEIDDDGETVYALEDEREEREERGRG